MNLQLNRSDLRLIYFNIRGRGELIRLILHAAEKNFVDQRVTSSEWPNLKPKMPFKKLPVLEVTTPNGDTVMLTESMAIARLLARTFNLYGNDAAEIYSIERINSLIASLMEGIYSSNLKDPDNYAKIANVEQLHEYFDAIEMALKDRKGVFIVGNRVTIGDLQVIVLIDTIDRFLPKFEHGCVSKLLEIKDNVLKQKPGVARYLRSRPVTDF
nr:glutathione S transferase [Hymenolepis microstoma]